jgi:hypothetical protein
MKTIETGARSLGFSWTSLPCGARTTSKPHSWGAERFTDGAVRTATPHDVHFGLAAQRLAMRADVLATAYAAHPERLPAGRPAPPVVSGFEPENLVTGVAAAAGNLPFDRAVA